jgi:uncharacterized damage-inducible protein DinB
MRPEEIRYLFDYDRWATEKILASLDGIPDDLWSASEVVGDRGLGSILVHQLGAAQRWRHGIQETGKEARPELEPLPSADELRSRWQAEWVEVDAWVSTITEPLLDHVHEGIAVWQMLVHVINHGTQHRSEAAALLTDAGHSAVDLDMIDYADALAARASAHADEPTGRDGR